jgi:hypothetical protein
VRPDLKAAGAGYAYNAVKERIVKSSQDPLKIGETLALDLLHEKSHELSRFAERVESPKDLLL